MNFATNIMPSGLWAAALTSFGLAVLLVGLVRQLALRHQVLDVPSERSSHSSPTPRGGGIGLVAAMTIVALPTVTIPGVGGNLSIAFLGVALVMLVGWLDDRYRLPIAPRFAVHVLGSIAVVPLVFTLAPAGKGMFWAACACLVAIATINLVNFMDGIDGLVAGQVAVFASFAALLSSGGAQLLAAVLVASTLGFLVWNWPPARIFLGDAGSGALGLLLVVILVMAADRNAGRLLPLGLPLLPLLADATGTLAARWVRGERVTTPHRSHLYQRVANGGIGHAPVALGYAALAALGGVAGILWVRTDYEIGIAAIALYLAITGLTGFVLNRRFPLDPVPDRQ
jgi:Fuc2NAc and GlcNAc transferase